MIDFRWACAVALTTFTSPAVAQDTNFLDARMVDLEAPVTSVTLYRDRAAVTRHGTITLQPGRHDLRILGLPQTIQPQTLQARINGTAKVLEVQYDQVPLAEMTSPETESIERRIDELQGRLDVFSGRLKLITLQEQFLGQFGIRAAGEARNDGGTIRLDLEVVRQHLQFLTDEQQKLIEQRHEIDTQKNSLENELRALVIRRNAIAGSSLYMRLAIVTIAVPEGGATSLDLTYLVSGATWEPSYNIRAAADGSGVDIEYDAMLTQRTGEDWTNVDLTLSTAQPMLAANPPQLQPWYVDVRRPQSPGSGVESSVSELEKAAVGYLSVEGRGLSGRAVDAQVAGEGPSVTYLLPRPVTVKTNIQKQQRIRIATIQSGGDFIHVAIPQLTEAVYIQGKLTNNSDYQLLPGPVSIFVDHDYVGPTYLDAVAPNGTFEMYFGIDPKVTATRTLLEKKTSKTGLLGGGLKTSYDYRIEIENGAGKGILLELWDRFPVSRSDQITVDLVDLSHPLAQDREYIDEQKPLGLLKWKFSIPTASQGASAFVVSYGVRINRAKNINMTGLPE